MHVHVHTWQYRWCSCAFCARVHLALCVCLNVRVCLNVIWFSAFFSWQRQNPLDPNRGYIGYALQYRSAFRFVSMARAIAIFIC